MAQALVKITAATALARISEAKVAYSNYRRLMDRVIAIRNGNGTNDDYVGVATYLGCNPANTQIGQTAFDVLDAGMAALTTVNNALSNVDGLAL